MLAICADAPWVGFPTPHLLLLLFPWAPNRLASLGHPAVETQPQSLSEVSLRTGKLEIQPEKQPDHTVVQAGSSSPGSLAWKPPPLMACLICGSRTARTE